MNTIASQIAKRSRVILILTKVTRILLYVLIGLTVLLLASTWVSADAPIFQIGKTKVYASVPMQALLGLKTGTVDARQVSDLRVQLVAQLVAFCLSQVMLRKIARLFTLIRESKDPFTADIAKPMKAFAVALGLIVAIQNTILGIVVGLVIFAFALIFEYGAQLQTQVDETL